MYFLEFRERQAEYRDGLKKAKKSYAALLVQHALKSTNQQAVAKLRLDYFDAKQGPLLTKEDSCELAAHNVLFPEATNNTIEEEANLLNELSNRIKRVGYNEAMTHVDKYAMVKSDKKVDAAYKGFYDAFLKYYDARYYLSRAKKEFEDCKDRETPAKNELAKTEQRLSKAREDVGDPKKQKKTTDKLRQKIKSLNEEIGELNGKIENLPKKIKELEEEIENPEKIYLEEKEAFAAALVHDALKNPSKPWPRSLLYCED